MKKAFNILPLFLFLGLVAGAQKLDASKVPAAAKSAFARQYPGLSAKWENENGRFEAGFKQNGQSMSALYMANGMLTETETAIKMSALPGSVISYVKDHYKGVSIKEAAKITKADGTINYEAEVNNMDLLFDASGKFLKETKD